MRVALTGTPGTGKTSLAIHLQQQGYTIVRLNDLAITKGCIDGIDTKRKSKLIDMTKLNTVIKKNYATKDLIFFESHVAHLLPTMQKVIILRCHPAELKKRLMEKKWNNQKIQENIDAEIIDVILSEAVEQHPPKNIFEIDTTEKTVEEVTTTIVRLAKKHFRPTKTYSIGQIDWSEEILRKYPS